MMNVMVVEHWKSLAFEYLSTFTFGQVSINDQDLIPFTVSGVSDGAYLKLQSRNNCVICILSGHTLLMMRITSSTHVVNQIQDASKWL